MVSFSPRRCAVALLCTALVLGSFSARAGNIVVSGDVSESGETFNGNTITFNLESVSADVVTVQLINSQVSGSGLSIQGYSGSVPSGVTTRVSMNVASTTVDDATIAFNGVMPENSDIRLVSATGTLSATRSLFDFTGLQLSGNVTVTVEECTVTWPSSPASTGSIITYASGSTAIGISDNGALFVLNSTATNGASVLHIDTTSVITVANTSVLAIDYCRCESCTAALVNIGAPLKVDNSSMFRVSHGTVVGAGNGLLTNGGSIDVSRSSLYVVSNCSIESGSFFDYDSGDSTDSGAFDFTVSESSTVSFIDLTGPSTGVSSSHPVPSSVDGTSTVNGGSCTINSNDLTTTTEYAGVGLSVTQVVSSSGANSGNVCANANCVPGNSEAGSALVAGSTCSCTCTSSAFNPPSCTSVTDPTQSFDSGATCSLANCATCDRLYPNERCTECDSGYDLTDTYTCLKRGETTTTTTTTTTTSTTSTTTTTKLCTVAFCAACVPTDGSTCTSCRNGYTLTNGRCLIKGNAAAGMQTVFAAAAVCVAAAVYAL